ncbi:MAG: RES domain-containing protein [Bacteroidia bacterium]
MEEEKYICYNCVGENYLKLEIEREGEIVTCSYCSSEEFYGYSLTEFADRIDTAFEQHYILSPVSPPENVPYYLQPDWEPEGSPVSIAILDAADVSEEIADDVREILERKHYDHESAIYGQQNQFEEDSVYDEKKINDIEWQEQWAEFEDTLKSRNRYFNKANEILLDSIFEGVDQLGKDSKKPAVRYIGLGTDFTSIYRARVFQSDERLKAALEHPDKELGAPPSEFTGAGRMNAKGISVFYGATNTLTALAEVRPPVGSRVTVARFNLIRKLKVLDLTALELTEVNGSIFDIEYAGLLAKTAFLKKLSQRMTKTIMPDDEHFEYLATQVIADYLASGLGFDGIIFPSAQSKAGLNITLFHHASRGQHLKIVEGAEINAEFFDWDGDETYISYKVHKTLPPEGEKKKNKDMWDLPQLWIESQTDPRPITLSIDLESLTVEHIESMIVKSQSFPVTHFEYQMQEKSGRELLDY